MEARNINKRIYEENMEIYVNGKKEKFDYKYKMKDLKETNVKFTINLSSFNTSKVKDMKNMFSECTSLKTIDLSSFDTSNVKDIIWMFSSCYS